MDRMMKFSDYPKDGTEEYADGILTINLSSWRDFCSIMDKLKELTDYENFIWRGQKRYDWPLLSTFDRLLLKKEEDRRQQILDRHLETFRNKRNNLGLNEIQDDDQLWGIGQHYGLYTPLLDWTECPFVAAFFAFSKKQERDKNECRVIYGLNIGLKRLLQKMKKGSETIKTKRYVEFPSVETINNPRLKEQKALFTKALNGVDIRTNVVKFSAKRPDEVILIEIKIPDKEREECLKYLKDRGIDYTTLFPDDYGVTQYCNIELEIKEEWCDKHHQTES
jgi:hypothetical protein